MLSSVMALALVTKVSYPGYVMADMVRSERCEVFADRVVTTRSFGASEEGGLFTVTDVRAVRITAGIQKVLARAAAEEETSTPNGLCDAPGLDVSASGEQGPFTLLATGGCGTPRKERKDGASRMLLDLVDAYCVKGERRSE